MTIGFNGNVLGPQLQALADAAADSARQHDDGQLEPGTITHEAADSVLNTHSPNLVQLLVENEWLGDMKTELRATTANEMLKEAVYTVLERAALNAIR